VGNGACQDCWRAKSPTGEGVIRDPGSQRERLLDFDFAWLEIAPGWWLLVGAAAVAGLVIAALTGAL
jgi:hypothetical protein